MKNKIKILIIILINLLFSDEVNEGANVYYFTTGPNLVSFDIIPNNGNIEDIFNPIENNIISIIGDGAISLSNNGNWVGSLTNINPEEGYWIMVNQISLLPISGEREVSPTYMLTEGANLISYPHTSGQALLDALPFYMLDKLIGIIGQNEAALFSNGEIYGSLNSFEPNKGYWFFISSPTPFVYNVPVGNYMENQNQNIFDNEILNYNLSTNQSVFFVNNLYLDNELSIENSHLSIYCNNELVGSKLLMNNMTDLIAMGNDGYGFTDNYCEENDEISIKINDEYSLYIIGDKAWKNNSFTIIDLSSHALGDLNFDNNLNVTDIIMIIDSIIHDIETLSDHQILLSDYNNDLYTNVTDIILILDTILE